MILGRALNKPLLWTMKTWLRRNNEKQWGKQKEVAIKTKPSHWHQHQTLPVSSTLLLQTTSPLLMLPFDTSGIWYERRLNGHRQMIAAEVYWHTRSKCNARNERQPTKKKGYTEYMEFTKIWIFFLFKMVNQQNLIFKIFT